MVSDARKKKHVIARQCAHCCGDRRECLWCYFFTLLLSSHDSHPDGAVDERGVVGGGENGLAGDAAPAVELQQGVVHQVVAQHAGGGDGIGNLGCLSFPDQIAHGGGDKHQLCGQYPAPAAAVGQQLLAHHRLQAHAEGQTDLGLLAGGKHIDNPVDGIGSGIGMETGEEGEMSMQDTADEDNAIPDANEGGNNGSQTDTDLTPNLGEMILHGMKSNIDERKKAIRQDAMKRAENYSRLLIKRLVEVASTHNEEKKTDDINEIYLKNLYLNEELEQISKDLKGFDEKSE